MGLLLELASRRSCTVIQSIVSHTLDEPVTFRRFRGNWKSTELDAMSGIVAKGMANGANRTCWGKGASEGKGWPCVAVAKTAGTREDKGVTATLAYILKMFDAPTIIDYLSLDVEGAEEAVLEHFPFNEYTFRVMSIERPSMKLTLVLSHNGYRYLCDNGSYGDELWVNSQTAKSLPPAFTVVTSDRHGTHHRNCPLYQPH